MIKVQLPSRAITGLLWRANNVRFISTSKILSQESKSSKSNAPPTNFNPRHLGVATDIYIPTAWKNLPNMLIHPIQFCNAVVRRMYTLGLNTVQVAIFRHQSGLKPRFLLWKNTAIETYVRVNQAFAKRKLSDVRSMISVWVEEALVIRSHQIPKSIELDWELVKFNDIPKLVSVQSMLMPGRPLEHIQLVYRFNTKQRLIKVNKKSKKIDKLDRDVIDYLVFLCDASTNELILMGSVFESKYDTKLPKNYEDDNQVAIARMKTNGDIYRLQAK